MDRRSFVKAGGSAALGLAFGGCAPRFAAQGGAVLAPYIAPGQIPSVVYPVHISWERVIRTTVGLRPFRPSGFRLEAERFDEKTIVHNFGHGGTGWSLSWGTATLATEHAVDAAGDSEDRRAAVLGAGIVGLTSARLLQRRGFDVTVYAAALSPETTSNMSWAGFTPVSGLVRQRTPEWDAQFRRAVAISYREHQLLVARGYGVSWIDSYSPTNSAGSTGGGGNREADGAGDSPLMPEGAETGTIVLGPGRHPFSTKYCRVGVQMRYEPSIYLEAIMRDIIAFGGKFIVRKFDTPRDLMSLDESVIVNCTGLGSKALFGDSELMPIKGQLTVLVPQPEINYTMGSMIPRSDGIVLGHTQLPDDWSLEVNQEALIRTMENALRNFHPSIFRRTPRAAPPMRVVSAEPAWEMAKYAAASPPPVEHFFGLES
jgi:glycine/D-amino acid oxidase-like deaminating enzyme